MEIPSVYTEETELYKLTHGKGSLIIPEITLDIFRCIICFFHLLFIIIPVADGTTNFGFTFIFLTMWGYYCCTIYLVLHIIFRYTGTHEKFSIEMRYFFFICLNIQTVIAIFFWTVLFPFLPDNLRYGEILFFEMIYPHTVPFLSKWIDFAFNTWLSHKNDAYAIVIFGLVYLVVNCTVTLATGTPVYPPINYKDLASYFFLLAAIILALLSFFVTNKISENYKTRMIKSKYDEPLISN